jgi:hypothetical protein
MNPQNYRKEERSEPPFRPNSIYDDFGNGGVTGDPSLSSGDNARIVATRQISPSPDLSRTEAKLAPTSARLCRRSRWR